jgi:AcrR family transcriptional regulator
LNDKKEEIRNYGRELFSSKGFKNTNITDITQKVGIGTGTFYNYYSSKEKLFMEIYLEENVKLKKDIMDSIDLDGDPLKVMKEFLFLNLKGMNANPILKEWYNRDTFNKIEQNYRKENGIEHVDFLYDSFSERVRIWQHEGKIREDIDYEMIMAIFTALVNIDTHKEEIGLQFFPQVLEYISEYVMKGLMDRSKVE